MVLKLVRDFCRAKFAAELEESAALLAGERKYLPDEEVKCVGKGIPKPRRRIGWIFEPSLMKGKVRLLTLARPTAAAPVKVNPINPNHGRTGTRPSKQ